MPAARSHADIMCLAVCPDRWPHTQGRMVASVAQGLGITFDRAAELAVAAAKADLINFEHGASVS